MHFERVKQPAHAYMPLKSAVAAHARIGADRATPLASTRDRTLPFPSRKRLGKIIKTNNQRSDRDRYGSIF
jgi:hypothetical protein